MLKIQGKTVYLAALEKELGSLKPQARPQHLISNTQHLTSYLSRFYDVIYLSSRVVILSKDMNLQQEEATCPFMISNVLIAGPISK
jgi:hypothetical protein